HISVEDNTIMTCMLW
nr:immunoglobulin heavy chain junction region [Mus musculus]